MLGGLPLCTLYVSKPPFLSLDALFRSMSVLGVMEIYSLILIAAVFIFLPSTSNVQFQPHFTSTLFHFFGMDKSIPPEVFFGKGVLKGSF